MPAKCNKHVYCAYLEKITFSTPNIQPWLPQSRGSFVQAEKWHLYFEPQMEICTTAWTENGFRDFQKNSAHVCASVQLFESNFNLATGF